MDGLNLNLSEVNWTEHIDKCERSKKSMALYCRENKLVYESMRFRKAERAKAKQILAIPTASSNAFVKVESTPTVQPIRSQSDEKKSYPQALPDPEWLARFIHTYVNSNR